MWRCPRRALGAVLLVALFGAACDAGFGEGCDEAGFCEPPPPEDADVFVEPDRRDMGDRPDIGPEDPPAPPQLCTWIEDFGCVDLDGDCYPESCDALDEARFDEIRDCDDQRQDVHPEAPEVCDEVDNNCDGRFDEGFDVGDACEGCGGAGKRECSVSDSTQAVCSTDFGQSDAPEPGLLEELCNGEDDDCDARVDETCRVDLPAAEGRSQPALCAGRIVFVEGGALQSLDTTDAFALTTIDAGPVQSPQCSPAGYAWIDAEAEDCSTPEEGPRRCMGDLETLPEGAEEASSLTGLAAIGGPRIIEGVLHWHAVVGDRPVINRSPLEGGGVETLFEEASDLSPQAADRVAYLRWSEGAPQVAVTDLERMVNLSLSTPAGRPAAPTLSADWIVWPVADSLWVVPTDSPRAGFQLTMEGGPHRRPLVDGDRLVWLDEGSTPPALRDFDLATGVSSVIVRAEIGAKDYAFAGDQVVFIAPTEAGPALFLHTLEP